MREYFCNMYDLPKMPSNVLHPLCHILLGTFGFLPVGNQLFGISPSLFHSLTEETA